ncbi:MAG TPA: DUF3047 domain-containing protein [Rubrivivax sp.]|nr:DUF3047 domain-containing protein [Rubrivivax sp.]
MAGNWPQILMRNAAMLVLLCGAVGFCPHNAHARQSLAPLAAAGEGPQAPWAYAGLPAQKPPPTRFQVRELDGRRVLHIEAERSYGNLVHPLQGVAAGALSWRWRIDTPLAAADLRSKAGDDAALKVCAMFDLPRERVPFVERQLLRVAESRFGEPLPNATLCYVWDPSWPRGSVVLNAFTKRVRFITLDGATGAWLTEQHDLASDFLRAFGDESRDVPILRAILVGADADNTGGRSAGWIDGLRLEPELKP